MKKTCTKCGELKDLEEFVKDKKCKDGHTHCCEECKANQKKIYRSKNKEKITKQRRLYRSKNKKKLSEQMKLFRSKNKKKLSGRNKVWHSENRINLGDSYVKRKILRQYNIASQDMTPEMIEAKRQVILTHRRMKEARDELNSARN